MTARPFSPDQGIPLTLGGQRAIERALPSSDEFPIDPDMDVSELRVALFSGNYNYVRDGANQALNRLVEYLLRQGVAVRVYAPTVKNPAFPPTGDLVDVPAIPIPGRS